MGALDDLMKLTGSKPAEPIISNAWAWEQDYSQMFIQAEQDTDTQAVKEDKWWFDKILDTWAKFINAVSTEIEHFVQNEDEDRGITDWKKYKIFQDDIDTNPYYSQEDIQKKEQELYQSGVLTDKYYDNIRRQRNTLLNAETPESTLESKIRKDLTAQLSFVYTQTQDPNVVRIINQAIDTQTDTLMDYYRRISGSDNAFDKTLAFQKLADFMKQWEWFIQDYAENVLKTKDNVSAYNITAANHEWFIRDMDQWNSELTTSSRWAWVKWSFTGLFDSDIDIADDIGNIWGLGTGLVNMATGLIWWLVHQTKRNVFGSYNSGMEELRLDYIEKPTDSWTTTLWGKLSQGLGEIWDGSDTLLEAVIPIFAASKIGLLTKTENAARLIEGSSASSKALGYSKYFWTQMLQDALVFDNAFQTFQKRGTNQDERTTNFWTNAVFNAGITTLFGKPVLKMANEYEAILKNIQYDVKRLELTDDFVRAANAGEINFAENTLYNTIKDMSEGVEPIKATISLTAKWRENYAKIVENTNRTLTKLKKGILTDEGFAAQRIIEQAVDPATRKAKQTEDILEARKNLTEQTIKEVTVNKATNGIKTIAQMQNNPTTESLLRQALWELRSKAQDLENTPLALTPHVEESILLKIKQMKSGDSSPSFTLAEEKHAVRLGEAIVDILKTTDPDTIIAAFGKDIIPIAHITPSIPYKTLLSYEELAAKINFEPVQSTYKDFMDSSFKKIWNVSMDTLLPGWVTYDFINNFAKRFVKNFGNVETGEISMTTVVNTIKNLQGKQKGLTAQELDALKLLHFPMLFEHFQRLKLANLYRDVSDEKLFASHPFFKLFEKTEDETFKTKIPVRDYRDLEPAFWALFQKMTRVDLKELPVMKYILREDSFKNNIIKLFYEVSTALAPSSQKHLWDLSQQLFIDPIKMKQIENLYITNKADGEMILKMYVTKIIKKIPALEWAYYATWLHRLPEKPFFLQKDYTNYAREFSNYMDAALKKADLPPNADLVQVKNNLLAKALDEIVVLNQIDYDTALHAYHRSAIANDVKRFNELIIKFDLALPKEQTHIQKEIDIVKKSIREKSHLVTGKWLQRDNVRLVLDSLRNNPDKYTAMFVDILKNEDIDQNIKSILNSIDAISFENARNNLRIALMATDLNHHDFVNLQELLLLPKDILGDRKSYLKIIQKLQNGDLEDAIQYKDYFLSQYLYNGITSIEEASAIIKQKIVRPLTQKEKQAKLFADSAAIKERLLKQKNSIQDDILAQLNKLQPDLFSKDTLLSIDTIPAKSIIIVGKDSDDSIDIIRKQQIHWSPDTAFLTLLDLKIMLDQAESRLGAKWSGNRTKTEAYYKDFINNHGPIYITDNALRSYAKALERHSTSVLKETEGLFTAMRNIRVDGQPLLIRLPASIHLSKNKDNVSLAIKGIETVDELKTFEKTNFVSDESKKALSALIPQMQKHLGIESIKFPIPAQRAKNILEEVFEDTDLWTMFSAMSSQFRKLKNKNIDILKYAKWSDFKKAYSEYVRKTTALIKKRGNDLLKDAPWVTKTFLLSEQEYLDMSRIYLLSKDIDIALTTLHKHISTRISNNFIKKLDDKNIDAQRYATYFILKVLRDTNYVVPQINSRELSSIVSELWVETIGRIADVARHLLNESRLIGELETGRGIETWITHIEQSLKNDLRIAQEYDRWALEFDKDIIKVSEPKSVFDITKTTDEEIDTWKYTEDAQMNILSAYQKAIRDWDTQLAAEFKGRYPEVFYRKPEEEPLDIEHMSIEQIDEIRKQTPDPSMTLDSISLEEANNYLPQKLSSAPIEKLFEYMGDKFRKQLGTIAEDMYNNRFFHPYMNISKDISSDDKIYQAFSKTASYKPENKFFVDPSQYIDNFEQLSTAIKYNDFFVYDGKQIQSIASKEQAQDTIMWSLYRSMSNNKSSKPAFNFYIVPKGSKIKLNHNSTGFLANGKTFIDYSEQLRLPAFKNGRDNFENHPLFKWAFKDQLSQGKSILGIVEDWVVQGTKKTRWPYVARDPKAAIKDGLKRLPEQTLFSRNTRRAVLREFESFFGLQTPNDYLWENIFNKIESEEVQRTLAEQLSEVIELEKNDSIMTVELIGYKPTVVITNPDTGEFIAEKVASEYLYNGEQDLKSLGELFDHNELEGVYREETILDDLREQWLFRINTFNGKVIEYGELKASTTTLPDKYVWPIGLDMRTTQERQEILASYEQLIGDGWSQEEAFKLLSARDGILKSDLDYMQSVIKEVEEYKQDIENIVVDNTQKEFWTTNPLTWYQRLANAIQVTHKAYYEKASSDGWYSEAEWLMVRLRSGMNENGQIIVGKWQGAQILANFEKVATTLLFKKVSDPTIPEDTGVDLLNYIKYFNKPDEFWQVLADFKRKMGSDIAFNREIMENIIKQTVADPKIQNDLIKDMSVLSETYFAKINRGNYTKTIAFANDVDRATINRFLSYMQEQWVLHSWLHFLEKATDKHLYIQKTMTHVNYFGFLDMIYKSWNENEIIEALKSIELDTTIKNTVEYFVDSHINSSFPQLSPEKRTKLRDLFLLKDPRNVHMDGDQILKEQKLQWWLKSVGSFILRETRMISTVSKFAPFVAWSWLLAWQNLFTNALQARALKTWLPEKYFKHDLIDYMLNSGFLDWMADYENIRALLMGSGKKTLVEKLFDKVIWKPAYAIAWYVPTNIGKNIATKLVETGRDAILTGAHNVQDHIMAPIHARLGITQAAFEVFGDNFDDALKALESGQIPKATLNKFIIRAKELAESGNNAYSSDVLRKHILSTGNWAAVSYLQGYHIQRMGELTTSLKKLADAYAWWEITNFQSFKLHLWEQNPELRKLLAIMLDTLHMGFYIDHYYDNEQNNSEIDYMKLFNEYVSSFGANIFWRMFTNLLAGHNDVQAYEDITGNPVGMINGISIQALNFIDSIPSMLFREFDVYKIVPRLQKAWQDGDVALTIALRKEALDQMFNGNSRFNIPDGTTTTGLIAIAENDDIIGSLLLWMRKTNDSIAMSDKLYQAGKVDAFINGQDEDDDKDGWLMRTIKALPFIDLVAPQEFSTTAQWKGLQALKTTDPIFIEFYKGGNNVWGKYIQQFETNNELYRQQTKEFFNDLTAFDYSQWSKSNFSLEKETFYASDMEAKEKLFTALLTQQIWSEALAEIEKKAEQAFWKASVTDELMVWEKILRDKMWWENREASNEEAGFQKLLAEADAKVPGSSRVIISYLANKEFYNWAKDFWPRGMNGYLDATQIDGDMASAAKKSEILQKYHPYLAIADKPSYIKILASHVKNAYPDVYKNIWTSQRTLVNALSLLDWVAHTQAISWEPNAGLIANVLSIAGKYIKNPIDRLGVIKNTAQSIMQMDIPQDTKNTVLSGLFVGNTETLYAISQDPEMVKQYPTIINWTNNLLYGVVDSFMLEWKSIHAMIEDDMSSKKNKAYYKQITGRPYTYRPYMKTNAQIQDKLINNAEKYGLDSGRNTYQPRNYDPQTNYNRNPEFFAMTHATRYALPRPSVLETYFRLSRSGETAALTSKELVRQTVKRSPIGDKNEYAKPRETTYVKKIMPAKPSVKWMRAPRIKKRGPHTDLPGGLPNVG